MTTLLPADLYPEILQFLSGEHLKSCSLVSSHFRYVAQSWLFWHIDFDMTRTDDWDFFGAERGSQFCSKARSLSVTASSRITAQSIGALDKFLRSFDRLRHFCCTYILAGLDTPLETIWPILTNTVCLRLQTLTIRGMKDVPLWDILSNCPLLEELKLQSMEITQPATNISRDRLPEIRSLLLENIAQTKGFERQGVLAQIRSVEFLDLQWFQYYPYITPLEFIDLSKYNLKHISFSLDFYDWVVGIYRAEDHRYIELSELTQLEKMSFVITPPRNNKHWVFWFSWLSVQLRRSPPLSLTKVDLFLNPRRSMYPKLSEDPPVLTEFNELALQTSVSIRVIVQARIMWASDYAHALKCIKDTIPSWWSMGRLEFAKEWI
ncbi:hypothetical protein DL96DRAFT_1816712 [Flagelloscypha sp. PMI_526]|nr:hypothetical protein DL96DRAFT_1816712 [Flagelloscypha sp. PMI_526]